MCARARALFEKVRCSTAHKTIRNCQLKCVPAPAVDLFVSRKRCLRVECCWFLPIYQSVGGEWNAKKLNRKISICEWEAWVRFVDKALGNKIAVAATLGHNDHWFPSISVCGVHLSWQWAYLGRSKSSRETARRHAHTRYLQINGSFAVVQLSLCRKKNTFNLLQYYSSGE